MPGQSVTNSAAPSVESVPQLPAFERIAPPAPSEDIAAQILAWTKPGDIVLDMDGRGGWVARAAIVEQRRAVNFETWPLTRLLAEVVLRPPDIRQLESAVHGIATTRVAGSTVRKSIDAMFAGTCPVCEHPVTIDAMVWGPLDVGPAGEPIEPDRTRKRTGRAAAADAGTPETTTPADSGAAGEAKASPRGNRLPIVRFNPEEALRPVGIEYPCPRCQQQVGGDLLRFAEATRDDVVMAQSVRASGPVREAMRTRFPAPRPTHPLVDEIIDLHTPRQLAALKTILDAVESEDRVAAVTPALRLALLHAVLLASRLNVGRDRPAPFRIVNGMVRVPSATHWRERNPWGAFEDGLKIVKAFVQRLEGGEARATMARLAVEMAGLETGMANVILTEATDDALRKLATHGERSRMGGPLRSGFEARTRATLMIGQPPLLWNADRLAASYHGTAWLFGAAAAATLPYTQLFDVESRSGSAADQPTRMDEAVALARAVGRSLAVAAPALATDGRAVLLLDDAEPASLVAAALGGAAAGCRLLDARLRRGGEDSHGMLVYVPPTGVVAPGPRTRANRPLPPVSGGAGDPGTVVQRGVFAPPERLDEGPFKPSVVLQCVTETAVELLRARGEPASFEQLLGELLLGLDRCGQLARLARQLRPGEGSDSGATDAAHAADADEGDAARSADSLDSAASRPFSARPSDGSHDRPVWAAWLDMDPRGPLPAPPPRRGSLDKEPPPGPVELLLNLIEEELDRPNNRRICRIEAGQYWLASLDDKAKTEQPLADRVEWSVFSLLSSGKGISRRTAFDRTMGMFRGGDAPDGALVNACLDSYIARGSSPESVAGFDDLETRAIEHDAIIARLADAGHRLGMRVWIGKRQQTRRIHNEPLAAWLDDEEREVHLPLITWAPEGELERVDCAWYVRRRATFLFEVEWTAMLGEPILTRHAKYPPDEKVVRFLVLPPERARLAAYKIAQSPLLRKAIQDRNWHFLKWNHLAEFSAAEELSLEMLEPYVGLAAPADRAGEQLPLFNG